ncbi:MAG: hypothetical protein WD737_14315 [Gemmatimonadota bacterium]
MSTEPSRTSGGSWALQGCLIGAVALFAVLLVVLLFLAYRQFRANTQPPLDVNETSVGWVDLRHNEANG